MVMGLVIHLEKQAENSSSCIYTFGPPDTSLGRVALDKDTGDVEIQELNSSPRGPSEQFYLAQVVSRLHDYHEALTYPAFEEWET